MNIKIKYLTKNILLILLFTNPFIGGDLFSVILFGLLGFYLLALDFKLPKLPPLGTLLLILIFIIGFIVGLFNKINRDYVRDIWIFIKPIAVILFGALLALKYKYSDEKIIRIILTAGLISAIYHFVEIVKVPGFQGMSFSQIRDETRHASLMEALSLALLIYGYRKHVHWGLPRQYYNLYTIIISLSVLLFVSRTMFLIFFIFIGFFFNYFRFSLKAFTVAALVIAGMVFIFSLPKQTNRGSLGTLINKVQKAPDELFFSEDNANDKVSINDDWRGYEAFRAIAQTISKGPVAVVFGNGFGSLVDLKLVMRLGNEDFRYIPRLHNGYAQIFFKTGILGIIFYACFLLYMYIKIYSLKPVEENGIIFQKIVMGSVITFLLTTSTITGIYNDSSLDSVLLTTSFCFVILIKSSYRKNIVDYKIQDINKN